MEESFVIMRIGDQQLDRLWRDVYIPAIKECGLEPKRVDKHNEGRLLTSEIAEFINRAKIIIADLTAERPNCYLEVGYAMGIGKFTNLILCAEGNQNIHFDLSGYEIIRWDDNNLDLFKSELIKKIRFRLKILNDLGRKSNQENKNIEKWIDNERKNTIEKFKKLNIGDGFLEVIFLPVGTHEDIKKEKDELLAIARNAKCHNTGWPIGVVLDSEEFKPKKDHEGIRAIVEISSELFGHHFDYWMLRKDGHFYFLRDFESETNSTQRMLYFDIRIYRLAEVFLYCSRLFKEFKFNDTDRIKILITHSGLKDRFLSAVEQSRLFLGVYKSSIEHVSFEGIYELNNISANIKSNVYEVAKDIFEYFDFPLYKNVCDEIVDKFLNNRM